MDDSNPSIKANDIQRDKLEQRLVTLHTQILNLMNKVEIYEKEAQRIQLLIDELNDESGILTMSNNDYGVSDINWDIYTQLGYVILDELYSDQIQGNFRRYAILDRSGKFLSKRTEYVGNRQWNIEDAYRECCPDFEHDLNAAITLWDGITTWGHVGLHTDQFGDIYYRAMTCGKGRDDGTEREAEQDEPARAICLSYLYHIKALKEFTHAK